MVNNVSEITPVLNDKTKYAQPEWAVSQFHRMNGLIEDTCEHGVGHPNKESLKTMNSAIDGIHGCDGCCSGKGIREPIVTNCDDIFVDVTKMVDDKLNEQSIKDLHKAIKIGYEMTEIQGNNEPYIQLSQAKWINWDGKLVMK